VKYIANNTSPGFLEKLEPWCDSMPLLLGYYYFWDGGPDEISLRRSNEGMPGALLYRCLKDRLDLVPLTFRMRWAVYTALDGTLSTDTE